MIIYVRDEKIDNRRGTLHNQHWIRTAPHDSESAQNEALVALIGADETASIKIIDTVAETFETKTYRTEIELSPSVL